MPACHVDFGTGFLYLFWSWFSKMNTFNELISRPKNRNQTNSTETTSKAKEIYSF